MRPLPVFLCLFIAATALTAQPVLFRGPATVRLGEVAIAHLAGGDFDRDGNRDLLTVHARHSIAVHFGRGDGTFRPAVATPLSHLATEIALGDFNGDDQTDIAMTGATSKEIAVFAGTGAGHFHETATLRVSDATQTFAFGDFNGDGRVDVAAATGPVLATFPGNGSGSFGAQVSTNARGSNGTGENLDANSMAVAFLDEDELEDLVIGTAPSSGGGIFLSTGDGRFVRMEGSGAYTQDVVLQDFSGDGTLDALRTPGPLTTIHYGSAFGKSYRFIQATSHRTGTLVDSLSGADMNGDGRPDVVAVSRQDGTVSVMLNTNPPDLSEPRTYLIGANPAGVVVGDYDGDGHADVATFEAGDNVVTILHGDGKGSLDGPHRSERVVAEEVGNLVVADFTGDGKADVGVATYQRPAMHFSVLPSTGNGGFGARQQTVIQRNAFTVGELTGDGKLDVVASSTPASSSVQLLTGNGDGSFVAGSPFTVELGRTHLADVNGDGRLDLVQAGARIAVHAGDGRGSFGSVSASPSAGVTGLRYESFVIDVNGDGKLDVAFVDHVYLGDGTGQFTALKHQPPVLAEERTERLLGVVDLDGDGLAERVSWVSESKLWIRKGKGNGDVERPRAFGIAGIIPNDPGVPPNVTWSDLDGDGHVDLVFAMGVLYGDGMGSFGDAERLRYRTLVSTVALADLDEDGRKELLASSAVEGSATIGIVELVPAEGVETTRVSDVKITTAGTLSLSARVDAETSRVDGLVSFSMDGVAVAVAPVDASGIATATVPVPAGRYAVKATFLANDRYRSSVATAAVEVPRRPLALSLSATRPRAQAGTFIDFHVLAQFTLAGEYPPPTGPVRIFVRGVEIAVIDDLSKGLNYSTSAWGAGVYPVTAVYAGDASWQPASAYYEQVMTVLFPSTVGLQVTAGADRGQNIELRGSVARIGDEGTITYYDGNVVLGTATPRRPALVVPTLAPGVHILTARFSGSATSEPAVSRPVVYTVNARPKQRAR